METKDELLNFHLSEIGVNYKKGHIKISQFTKFDVLSLDFNHEESFQKSAKLETLVNLLILCDLSGDGVHFFI